MKETQVCEELKTLWKKPSCDFKHPVWEIATKGNGKAQRLPFECREQPLSIAILCGSEQKSLAKRTLRRARIRTNSQDQCHRWMIIFLDHLVKWWLHCSKSSYFIVLRQDLIIQPWLAWNSGTDCVDRPDCPWCCRDPLVSASRDKGHWSPCPAHNSV